MTTDDAGVDADHDASADAGHDGHAIPTPKDPCVVSAAPYETSCIVDTDCTAVWFGDLCSAATCAGCQPNGAVNNSSASQYFHDVETVVDATVNCFCPPPQGGACCDQGTCTYSAMPCGN